MSLGRPAAWSLVAAAACWGIATAVSKRAVEEIAPTTLLPIELAISIAVLGLAATVTRDARLPARHRAQLAWLGVLNPGLSYALSLAGLQRITASASALLWALEPILILALAWFVLRHRPSRSIGIGAALALVGVILVVAQHDVGLGAAGVTLTIAGVMACAVYTVLSSRYLADSDALGVVLIQQTAALAFAIVVAIASFAAGHGGSLGDVSGVGWLSALAAGALYYGVAFWFYLDGLRTCSPGVAGLFINLVPIFGITTATVFLDERLTTRQWIGAAITIGAITAVAVIQRRPANPTRVSDEPQDATRPMHRSERLRRFVARTRHPRS